MASTYEYRPRGGQQGIAPKAMDMQKLAKAVGSKYMDEYIPLPNVPFDEQVRRIAERKPASMDNAEYWEDAKGSHGWCDGHTGEVVQYG